MTQATQTNMSTRLGYRPLDMGAPAWLRDISRFLSIRGQFVISGNIHDLVLMPHGDVAMPLTVRNAVAALLEVSGYNFLLSYDPFDHFQVIAATPMELPEAIAAAKAATGLNFDSTGRADPPGKRVIDPIRRLAHSRSARGGLVIEDAARLNDEDKEQIFGGSLKLSRTASQVASPDGRARFNPIFWLVDEPNDLPGWLTLNNERIRSQVIPKPDIDTRLSAAKILSQGLPGYADLPEGKRDLIVRDFARLTEGFTLSALVSTAELARDQGYDFEHLHDAVRLYKLGVTDNPWKQADRRRLIAEAQPVIEDQVKGQSRAIAKTVTALKRAVEGMSGAHASGDPVSGGPKAVFFFAGPTGVGKTELAKAITSLLFGDERAYIRFDMSEFSQEQAEARLIGAPPGYVGHDAGGELTKAIRQRPFSVVLFDEIEKAHPRIFDKFLQILQDGRLTDSRGETAYFTEAIIVFTSNLGIYSERPGGERVANVDPSMSSEEVEHRVRHEIDVFFTYKLGRPEINGRIGDNIVVFDFISKDIGAQILDRQISNIKKRMAHNDGSILEITEPVREYLIEYCTEDLSKGGRGIGNRLETAFLNPLASALFHGGTRSKGSVIRVESIEIVDGLHEVRLG